MTVIPFRERVALEAEPGGVIALCAELITYYMMCMLWGVVKGIAVLSALIYYATM